MSEKLVDELPTPTKKIRAVVKGTHPAKCKWKSNRPDILRKIWNLASRGHSEAAKTLAKTHTTVKALEVVTEGEKYLEKRKNRKNRKKNLAVILRARILIGMDKDTDYAKQLQKAEENASVVQTFDANSFPKIKDCGDIRYVLINVPTEQEYQTIYNRKTKNLDRISNRQKTLKTLLSTT